MAVATKKGYKIKKALKVAARLPTKVSGVRGIARSSLTPLPGEIPVVLLRVQILGCTEVLSKDKSGTSDVCVFDYRRHYHYTLCGLTGTISPQLCRCVFRANA